MCKLSSILNNAAKREEGFMDHFGKINLFNYIVKLIHSTNGRIKLSVQVKRHHNSAERVSKPWGDLRIRCTLYKVMAGLQNEVQDVYSDMHAVLWWLDEDSCWYVFCFVEVKYRQSLEICYFFYRRNYQLSIISVDYYFLEVQRKIIGSQL